MVQDRQQQTGVNNTAISLHSLPLEGQQHPPDRPLQIPEGNRSSIQNFTPVEKGGKQSRTLSFRDGDEGKPNLQLVLNMGKSGVEDAEETGTYIEDGEDDAGMSFVQNAEEPESPHHNGSPGDSSDDGIGMKNLNTCIWGLFMGALCITTALVAGDVSLQQRRILCIPWAFC